MSFQKNIIATYAAQIVSVICSFSCSVLAARMLGAFGQGEYALYINFILLAALLLGMGLPASLVHFIASGKIERKKIFSVLLLVLFVGFVLMIIVLSVLFSFSFFNSFMPMLIHSKSLWFWMMLLHLFFLLVNIFMTSILQAEGRFRKAGYILIIGSMLLLGSYALRYFSIAGTNVQPLNWMILSMMSVCSLQTIFYIREIAVCDRNYFHLGRIELKTVTPLFQFAFMAFATNFIQFLSYKMDIWFVNYYDGKQLTGIYSLSVSLAQMLWLLPAAIQAVLYTFISTHAERQLNIAKTIKTTKQITLYAISAGIAGYVLSIYLIPVLFGEEFRLSIHIIGILLLGIVPFCLSMAVSAYFAATNRVNINLRSAIIGFVVCLVADILFIPCYGIMGAAIASVFSYVATVGFLLFKFRQEIRNKT